MKTIKQKEQELFMKERRIDYWEKNHRIPKLRTLFDYENIPSGEAFL